MQLGAEHSEHEPYELPRYSTCIYNTGKMYLYLYKCLYFKLALIV